MALAAGGLNGETVVRRIIVVVAVVLAVLAPLSARAQVDSTLAKSYFQEAADLCAREGGKLWGVSLCGPMVFADTVTKTTATNQPAPDAPPPPALGFANSALQWGDTKWSTYVWQIIPPDDRHLRARLFIHELFHRVQGELGFVPRESNNDHLDGLDGRYWMQLEWRALARALATSGAARSQAIRDAFGFRTARHAQFSGSAENERLLEMNEGLAQYTGTVASCDSPAEAVTDAIDQLKKAADNQTFVRTFAYASGAAYGLLLDAYSPGWTRNIKNTDDLGDLLMRESNLGPDANAKKAAARYDGAALRLAEEKREAEQKAKIAELKQHFVDGPVLVVPRDGNASFTTAGITPIPGFGTIYPNFRVKGEWGSLEAANVLMSPDRQWLSLPAPRAPEGSVVRGDGWTATLAPGWVLRPGPREGDFKAEHTEN